MELNIREMAMLRMLNKENSDKALDFPVKAFSALTEFEQLTLEEIIEITELDETIMLPVIKKLTKQRILRNKNGKITINQKLFAINRMIK